MGGHTLEAVLAARFFHLLVLFHGTGLVPPLKPSSVPPLRPVLGMAPAGYGYGLSLPILLPVLFELTRYPYPYPAMVITFSHTRHPSGLMGIRG